MTPRQRRDIASVVYALCVPLRDPVLPPAEAALAVRTQLHFPSCFLFVKLGEAGHTTITSSVGCSEKNSY